MNAAAPLAACALILAACAKPDPPLLSLAGRQCDAKPVLQPAIPVPFNGSASATLGPAARCVADGQGGTTTYAVFQLPDAPAPYTITVASIVTGTALVSPELSIWGPAGEPARGIPPSAFRYDITGLQTGLRSRPGERFLMASADPHTLGQPRTLRLSLRQQGVDVAAGPIFIPIIIPPATAQTAERPATLSLNGTIRVSATPIMTVP